MKLEKGESEKPFCVEFDPDPEAEVAEGEERFANAEEAQRLAEEKASSYKAVWVSEIGTYETRRNKLKVPWRYSWWSPSTWSDMAPIGRGTGFPDFQGITPIAYTSYAQSKGSVATSG